VLADKAYDADRIRELIQDQGATPNIPPKSNRRWKPCFSKRLYRERNLIERFFSKLKHFRRVATRYDKLAANFLAMIQLASMRLWLRAYESTASPRRHRCDLRPHPPGSGRYQPRLGDVLRFPYRPMPACVKRFASSTLTWCADAHFLIIVKRRPVMTGDQGSDAIRPDRRPSPKRRSALIANGCPEAVGTSAHYSDGTTRPSFMDVPCAASAVVYHAV
jgi:hypothetical protein